MKSDVPKQCLPLGGHPVIFWAVHAFATCTVVDSIVVVVPGRDDRVKMMLGEYAFAKPVDFVSGGSRREDSVRAGLDALPQDTDYIIVHDGARPLVTEDIIQRAVAKAFGCGAAIVAVPAADTIKVVNERGTIVSTPPRETLWLAQTPQVFRKDLLVRAYAAPRRCGFVASDDALLVELLGEEIAVVQGAEENVKITTPLDLAIAEAVLVARMARTETGVIQDRLRRRES